MIYDFGGAMFSEEQKKFGVKDPKKLKSFLGGDLASKEILLKRGTFLSILLQKHLELMQEVV